MRSIHLSSSSIYKPLRQYIYLLLLLLHAAVQYNSEVGDAAVIPLLFITIRPARSSFLRPRPPAAAAVAAGLY
jgi:hypothetical protein